MKYIGADPCLIQKQLIKPCRHINIPPTETYILAINKCSYDPHMLPNNISADYPLEQRGSHSNMYKARYIWNSYLILKLSLL
jgi:hypothetical protein